MIQVTTAAHVLAQLRARNAVKDQIRKQGLKPSHYAAREITGWANLDEHPELIPEAIAQARAMILAGALGKRAQRALCANLSSDAQKEKAQKSITSAVQMLGAE